MPTPDALQHIIEAALLVAGRPLTLTQIQKLFDEADIPDATAIRAALTAAVDRFSNSGIQVCEVAGGWQMQSRPELGAYMARLWEERPPRYSRALLETLALIAWRQPITRAEVEDIRGVTVSSHITRTLMEREWIRVIGHRDVPGKPALYGTTKTFLDHFNLKSLKDLPTLADIQDPEEQAARLQAQLDLPDQVAAPVPEVEPCSDTQNTDLDRITTHEEPAEADITPETENIREE